MIDETQGPGEQNAAPEGRKEAGERVAFCQNCGKPLTNETIRRVGSAIYCEPCLIARLEGGTAGAPGAGWVPVGAAPGAGAGAGPGVPIGQPGVQAGNAPSPWLAAFLGLIPGVGAMYNGQYAKGLAHLVIFAIVDSLAKNVNDIFGLLVMGWVFYQVFDAYQTAQARRDGTPLPNAFGLNDIGDRLGFGRNWPGSASRPVTSSTTAGWASAAAAGPAAAAANAQGPGWTGYVPPTNFSGASAQTPPPPPPVPPSAYAAASTGGAVWDQAPYASAYAGEPWRSPAGAPVPPRPLTPVMPPTRRFPIGAAWLIALGLIFLLANLNGAWRLSGSWIVAISMAALGAYLLFRRIEFARGLAMAAGETHPEDGGLWPRLVCQIRGPIMLLVLAVLFALQAAGIRTLGQTWGLLLIAFGALLILERTAGKSPWYPVDAPVATSASTDARKDGK